ncbi:MAG: DUF1295 domain-containing protein [Gammaproteobacteria bacterium]|nr:DUF1295 domain-containing protein [Gammaproteobacteria bacterium]
MQMLILTLLWLVYFLLHSALASLACKQWLAGICPACMPWYRLVYNLLALVGLFPPLYFMWRWRGELIIDYSGIFFWLANGIALFAIAGFFKTLDYYDLAEFSGKRQLREQSDGNLDREKFHLSPLHRYVRHPWYFLGLLILWTRDMDKMQLLSSLLITLYLVVGSILEERKLVRYHGEIYRRYQQRVAGLFPLPWKFLKSGEDL